MLTAHIQHGSDAQVISLPQGASVNDSTLRLADYEAYVRLEVEKGLADVRAGRVVSDEEMEAEAELFLSKLATEQ